MPRIPFCGPTYNGRSTAADASRAVNFYPEIPGTQDPRSQMYLVGTPGTKLFTTSIGAEPVRELYTLDNQMYAVIDNGFYSISTLGIRTLLGNLITTTGRVSIADNGTPQLVSTITIGGGQIMIVDGTEGYIYDVVNDTFGSITSLLNVTFQGTGDTVTLANHGYYNGDAIAFTTITTTTGISTNTLYYVINRAANTFQLAAVIDGTALPLTNDGTGTISSGWQDVLYSTNGPQQVQYINGYFVVSNGTMTFWASNKYDGRIWNALAVASASTTSDPITALAMVHQQLIVMNTTSTEVWFDAGVPVTEGSPFSTQSGSVYDFGCAARWSVAKGGGAIFFVSTQRISEYGQAVGVSMVTDSTPKVISTPAIAYRITKSPNIENIFGYCYAEEGHVFYILTNPDSTDGFTLGYDLTTGMWHERSSYATDNYVVLRHVSNCYTFCNNKHYIGDYRSPTIYEMSGDYYTDNGLPIVSFRTAATIRDEDELQNLFINMLALDMETGVSVDPTGFVTAVVTLWSAGDAPVIEATPYLSRTDIAATATGFTTVAGDFSTMPAGTVISIAGFTTTGLGINGQYTVQTNATGVITTTPVPPVTKTAGDTVTISDARITAANITATTGVNGYFTVPGVTISGILPNSRIAVTGFTNAALNTVQGDPPVNDYIVVSADNATKRIYTDPVPPAADAGGDTVTIYNYNNVTILANGTITGGISLQTTPASGSLYAYPAGSDGAIANRPTVTGTDIAATYTGFTSSTTMFTGMYPDTKIAVTGFTNTPLNTSYDIIPLASKALKTVVAPTAPEAAGNTVTIVNYKDVLFEADGSITAGANGVDGDGASITLAWSNDGGYSWSDEYPVSVGLENVRTQRIRWRRLGYSDNRVFRITIVDGIKKVILGAYLEAGK